MPSEFAFGSAGTRSTGAGLGEARTVGSPPDVNWNTTWAGWAEWLTLFEMPFEDEAAGAEKRS